MKYWNEYGSDESGGMWVIYCYFGFVFIGFLFVMLCYFFIIFVGDFVLLCLLFFLVGEMGFVGKG